MPTVPEVGGCAGCGASPGGAARWVTEGLEYKTSAGKSGQEESACCLAAVGAPSLSGC